MSLAPALVPALRQVRACGVIRTRFDHDGLIGLYEAGLVDANPVEDDEDAVDYRLTTGGRAVARRELGE